MTEDQEKTNSLHWLQNPPFFSAEFLKLSQLAETCEPFHELETLSMSWLGELLHPPAAKSHKLNLGILIKFKRIQSTVCVIYVHV